MFKILTEFELPIGCGFCSARISKVLGRTKFDAEEAIDLSSPYKGTAERSSAAKKPHIKMKKPVDFFDGFQPFIVYSKF